MHKAAADSSFEQFASAADPDARVRLAETVVVTFSNASGDAFHVLESELHLLLETWRGNARGIAQVIRQHPRFDPAKDVWEYQEKPYRDAFARYFYDSRFDAVIPLARSQTRSLVMLLSKYVGWRIGRADCAPDDRVLLDPASLDRFFALEDR